MCRTVSYAFAVLSVEDALARIVTCFEEELTIVLLSVFFTLPEIIILTVNDFLGLLFCDSEQFQRIRTMFVVLCPGTYEKRNSGPECLCGSQSNAAGLLCLEFLLGRKVFASLFQVLENSILHFLARCSFTEEFRRVHVENCLHERNVTESLEQTKILVSTEEKSFTLISQDGRVVSFHRVHMLEKDIDLTEM